MQNKFRPISTLIAITMILIMLFSIACVSKTGTISTDPPVTAEVAVTGDQPEQTSSPSPEPTPSLTMEQKAAMVWMEEDFQTCYPFYVFIFNANINGRNRLIWTCLEDELTKRKYDFQDPFTATKLIAYDLINREYLFTLSFPETSLEINSWYFYKYITAVSPALKDSTFSSSANLFQLDKLYDKESIIKTEKEIKNVVSMIDGYIYVTPNTIGSWDKSRAVEAYCAVTPEDYILPYWEYIPNAVKPEDLDSFNSSTSLSLPATEYSDEQKELLLGSKANRDQLSIGNLDVFFCKVNGKKRIIWTVSYDNSSESDDEFSIKDFRSVFNNEYLFSLRYPMDEYINGIMTSRIWKYYFKSSTQLEGIKLLGSCGVTDLSKSYSEWGIPYDGNELIDSLKSSRDSGDFSGLNMPVKQDDIVGLYLDTVPDAYLMPFWEYVPNAVTPDAFFTPAIESSPSTAP